MPQAAESISAWPYLYHATRAPCPVFHPARELPAGRVDIVPARPARRHDQPRSNQHFGKAADGLARRALETGIGEWVERNQVQLARHVAHQRDQLSRMLRAVVDAI